MMTTEILCRFKIENNLECFLDNSSVYLQKKKKFENRKFRKTTKKFGLVRYC